MKRIIQHTYGEANVLQQDECLDPVLNPGEVLIRVAWAGVNFADIKQRRGGKATGTFPFVLGLDVTGIVIASNPNSAFQIGDRVMAFAKTGSCRNRSSGRATRISSPTIDLVAGSNLIYYSRNSERDVTD